MVSPAIGKWFGEYGYNASEVPDLTGKTVVGTGLSNGIGLSYARTLFSHGADVHIISHTKEIGESALKYIETGDISAAPEDYSQGFGSSPDTSSNASTKPGKTTLYVCDLADLKSVAKIAQDVKKNITRLDLFAAIAGVGVNAFSRTVDGYDSHLTINCLSHHLLLSHLYPIMKRTAQEPNSDVRILSMSSESHRHDIGGPGKMFGGDKFAKSEEFKRDVGPAGLYGRSKLGNILFTKAIVQRHLANTSILSFATHPGGVATGQQEQMKDAYGTIAGTIIGAAVRPIMRRPDQGALSILWASIAADARDPTQYPNGSYFSDPKVLGSESNEGKDQELIDNFYEMSEKVIREIVGDQMGTWS